MGPFLGFGRVARTPLATYVAAVLTRGAGSGQDGFLTLVTRAADDLDLGLQNGLGVAGATGGVNGKRKRGEDGFVFGSGVGFVVVLFQFRGQQGGRDGGDGGFAEGVAG